MLKSEQAGAGEVAELGLNHRVYLPDSGRDKKPCVVLVHGRAGNASVMWTFSKVFQEQRPLVVSPEAFLDDPIGGKSWWLVSQEERESKKQTSMEKLELAVSKLENFLDKLPQVYNIDTERMYAFGFSQGAAMVSMCSLKKADRFKSVGVLAGFIPSAIFDAPGFVDSRIAAGAVSLPKYFMGHGTEDEIIPLKKAEWARDKLCELGADVEFQSEDVGHKIGSQSMKALKEWFGKQWVD